MSPFRIDLLARLVVSGLDRRDVLRGIAATLGAVGIMGTGPAFDDAAARKRKRRKHKHKKKPPPPIQCPGGEVLCEEQCVEGVCCPGAACGEADCTCEIAEEGDAFCAADVVILCTNPGNCISSDDCGPDERCVSFGQVGACCVPECGSIV